MHKKDGSLDKRFKENKVLKNFNLGNEFAELEKLRQKAKAEEAEERLIEKTKNNFLKRSDSGEIINEISDLTSYFLIYSDVEMWDEKQNLLWFVEDYKYKKFMSFPSNFSRGVIDSYFGSGIKWDSFGSEIYEQEHSIFKTKFGRFSSLILQLTEIEVSTIVEISEMELAKKPAMIEKFGYCYNYDKTPLWESEFREKMYYNDTISDFLFFNSMKLSPDNFCLKHLTNKELTDLEESNRIEDEDSIDGFLILDYKLNESIQLERQRRKSLKFGGFKKNIFSSILKKYDELNESIQGASPEEKIIKYWRFHKEHFLKYFKKIISEI